MGESKAVTTPMEPCLMLTKDGGKILEDATLFRQLVGSLFYSTITRPDISYSVGVVSQFMSKPCESHFIAAKRILRYIKGTLNFGLLYKKNSSFLLTGFVDVDWADYVNDRRSTTGYCFNTGSAAITWCSKKQSTVALSSCEAEYVDATMATQECFWLKRLIEEIFSILDYPVPIHCDNESAIKLAGNPDIQLKKIGMESQVADIFTKALSKTKFDEFRSDLGVIDSKLALSGSIEN
ncbi:secreted RxLR effector protein 161-like [Henckelia pumila]|uniref:secreted RxLR effector protein 161-like n=1 Tax=Henckelia pumila TaxID=405737 RepID=UPI003C6E79D5